MKRRIVGDMTEMRRPHRPARRSGRKRSKFGELVWWCFVRGAATAAGGAVISMVMLWIESRG